MRGLRSTLLLLVVAAGLGAYLYFIDAKKPVGETTVKQKIFSFDAAMIEQVQLKANSGSTTLKKGTDGWSIVQPVSAPADQNNASDVAASLANLEQDRVVDENATDLKPYGLAPPRIDVSFNVAGEKDPHRLQIGDKSPTSVGVYARVPESNKVYLVSTSVDTSLNRSTLDLRDKTALKFDQEKVDSVELVSKDQQIRIVRSGDEWKLVKPVEAPADLTSVEGLIGQLHSSQMAALKESPEEIKDLKKFGLDKPEVTATLGMGSARVVLELGSAADTSTFWARDASKPFVFSINNGLAEELRKKPFDLRRKEIFQFRPFNTTRFEIVRGKDTRAFERVKGTGPNPTDTWKQVLPTDKPVDSSNLEGALLEFSNLRAQAAVDKAGPETGLNNPAAVITVKFDDGKKEERVTIGKPGSSPDVFAARPDQPGALKIETGKYDDALKKLDALQ
jgi:Domain of unknown function (DUF4340)